MMNQLNNNVVKGTPLNIVATSINIMILTSSQINTIGDLKRHILRICYESDNKPYAPQLIDAYNIDKAKMKTPIDLNRALNLIYNCLQYGAITEFDYCYTLINCGLMHREMLERIHKEFAKRNINCWQVLEDAKKQNQI